MKLRPGKVSIIIPARNEEVNLEGVLRALAPQEGWAEIIVVNDQSDERSAEILQELRGEIDNLVVLNAPELPAGWVGKNHALDFGAAFFVLLLGGSAWTYLRGGELHWKGRSYPVSRF